MQTTDWEEFIQWQKSYKLDIHGEIDSASGNYLSYEHFRAGGVQGHAAPKCVECDPPIGTEET